MDQAVGSPRQARSYASVADRLVALVLDAIVMTIVAFLAAVVVALVLGAPVEFHDGASSVSEAVDIDRGLAAVDAVIVGALTAAYCIGFWRRGGTPGQRALGLMVSSRLDGRPAGLTAATVRWLALVAPFSVVAVLDAGIAGIGTVLWIIAGVWYLLLLVSSARAAAGGGWHDRLAGTAVSRAIRPVVWGAVVRPQDPS